jgi:para-nitrobenzyl esterase
VTVNYRLGLLGFLAHPALSAESSYNGSGNYGIMDQQASLSWIERNIAAFGGDPGNITIFGESAGGLSVHAHLASARSAGLFQRAIIQSGAYALTQPVLASAEATGVYYATTAGCFYQTAACLRALPVANLLVAGGVTGFTPNIDNYVLTHTVLEALTTGSFNQVPLLEGSNHDEMLLLTDLTNSLFACTSRTSARLASRFVPTFVYELKDPNVPQPFSSPFSLPIGAYHQGEIQYLLNLPAFPPPRFTPEQQALADAMVAYWTHFAKYGDPNGDGNPAWPAYTTTSDAVQSLTPAAIRPTTDFAVDHQCSSYDP